MQARVDLNADLGEGFPWDNQILAMVTSASIACGAHAGSHEGIRQSLAAAEERGVVVGAHPGYADRANFGRAAQHEGISSSEIERLVSVQIEQLQVLGADVQFVKPHGALYNQAQQTHSIAHGIVAAVVPYGWPILGIRGGMVEEACRAAGLRFVAEGFADRRYQSSGQLVPRSQTNAILEDPAEIVEQVLRLVESGVETLCLHGDNPHAVSLGTLIHATLGEAGVVIRPFLEL